MGHNQAQNCNKVLNFHEMDVKSVSDSIFGTWSMDIANERKLNSWRTMLEVLLHPFANSASSRDLSDLSTLHLSPAFAIDVRPGNIFIILPWPDR